MELRRAILRALRVAALGAALAIPASAGAWENANPGAGGAFTAIGGGPTGILLCGSDLGGAYRSLDRGRSWDAIGPARGLTAAHVSAVAFDPQDAAIQYLGSEWGLFRSGDGGDTFQRVSPATYIAAVAAAPAAPATVYAAFHPTYDSTTPGLYRSTDRGRTWATRAGNLPNGLRITKLIVHPTNADRLYLVSGADLFIANASPSLWTSGDGGATWSQLAARIGNVWDLAIDPANPQQLYVTVYAGTPRSNWSGAVYKSADGGATWVQKGTHTGGILLRRDQPGTLWVIDPDRGSADAASGVWQSTDSGDTWTRKSAMSGWDAGWQNLDWAYGGNGYGMAKIFGQDLSDPAVLLWTHWQFVFGSFDGGARFENLFTTEVTPGWWRSRGIENVAVVAAAISEASPRTMYTGYYDIGMWRSLDGGASWQSCNAAAFTGAWEGHGGCAASIVADPARAGVVWATMGEEADLATVVRSTDSGTASSWSAASGLSSGFVYGLSLDRSAPANARTLFVTANGDVYRSTNDGASWSMVFNCNTCRVTAVGPDGAVVYAGGEGGLWRSESRGDASSWARVGPAEFAGANPNALKEVQWEGVHGITTDPALAGRVWVAAHGAGRGIYRSDDRGTSWTRVRATDYARAVAVDPTNSAVVWATSSHAYKAGGDPAGSEGLLRSTDAGQTWTSLSDGLAWPFAGPLALDPADPGRVLVGSPGTGFWIGRFTANPTADAVRPAAILDLR